MKEALVDVDVQPYSSLERAVDERLALKVVIEPTGEALVSVLMGHDYLFTTSTVLVTGLVLERTDLKPSPNSGWELTTSTSNSQASWESQ